MLDFSIAKAALQVHLQSLGGGQDLIPNNQNRFVLLSGNAV